MAQFLYRLQPVNPSMLVEGPSPDEEACIAEHFEYLAALTHENVVLIAGRTMNSDRSSFGVVIFEAGTEEQARDLMLADPAVRAGVFSAELFPFRISLSSMTRCGTREAQT